MSNTTDLGGYKRFTYEEVRAAVTRVPHSTLEIWREIEEPRVVEHKKSTALSKSRRRHLFHMLNNLAKEGYITYCTGWHPNNYFWWKEKCGATVDMIGVPDGIPVACTACDQVTVDEGMTKEALQNSIWVRITGELKEVKQ